MEEGRGFWCVCFSISSLSRERLNPKMYRTEPLKDTVTRMKPVLGGGDWSVRGPDQRAFSVSGVYKTQASFCRGFPGGAVVKNLAVMQETLIQSLGWEEPLEKEIATHSCTLTWKIPCTEEPGGLKSIVSKKNWTPLSD